MNIEELVKMPEPMVFQPPGFGADGSYTADQLRAHSEAVAAAVAKRCADVANEFLTQGRSPLGKAVADAIRREFGEVSK